LLWRPTLREDERESCAAAPELEASTHGRNEKGEGEEKEITSMFISRSLYTLPPRLRLAHLHSLPSAPSPHCSLAEEESRVEGEKVGRRDRKVGAGRSSERDREGREVVHRVRGRRRRREETVGEGGGKVVSGLRRG
jgi:hypothetical protein